MSFKDSNRDKPKIFAHVADQLKVDGIFGQYLALTNKQMPKEKEETIPSQQSPGSCKKYGAKYIEIDVEYDSEEDYEPAGKKQACTGTGGKRHTVLSCRCNQGDKGFFTLMRQKKWKSAVAEVNQCDVCRPNYRRAYAST